MEISTGKQEVKDIIESRLPIKKTANAISIHVGHNQGIQNIYHDADELHVDKDTEYSMCSRQWIDCLERMAMFISSLQ